MKKSNILMMFSGIFFVCFTKSRLPKNGTKWTKTTKDKKKSNRLDYCDHIVYNEDHELGEFSIV